ncbi:MAG TPA: OmpA family protein [Candidatus Binatia bacterium]|nr:OmpA family protein [Candidatus Binatia bacterium]
MSLRKLIISIALIAFCAAAVFAQEAKLPVKVNPSQAYVFLDGVAIKDGDVMLKTTPGKHTIAVYNYGFTGEVRDVTLQAGKNEPQSFNLKPAGDPVPGNFGYLQIEGPERAAVLLNGTTPEYHVGHVDMFNNHIGWFQQLLLLPGTHQVMVTRNGSTVWSGPVQINAGERVILRIPKGEITRQSVSNTNGPKPRFTAALASAAVAIAPVSATLAATPGNINCNDTSKLAYSSVDALHTTMKDEAEAKPLPNLSGEMSVQPKHTTTYDFQASGPGGLAKQQATVNVNPVVTSTLEATPAEMGYVKVGNKILRQDAADLKWTTTNADTMSITPMGPVAASGEQKITAEPKSAANGPVDETQTYTLTATNVCGGSDTKTAQLRTKGMIEPYVLSVFFPTAYPDRKHPDAGLLASEQERLMKLTSIFPLYAEHTPDAKILIRGYADLRGKGKRNMALSERRIAIVKAFLVSHGIPENKITIDALGETQMLDEATVKQLDGENPFNVDNAASKHKPRTVWLAYNRRIDIEVQPVDVQTSRFFPYSATDSELLLQTRVPSLKQVAEAEQAPGVAAVKGGMAP